MFECVSWWLLEVLDCPFFRLLLGFYTGLPWYIWKKCLLKKVEEGVTQYLSRSHRREMTVQTLLVVHTMSQNNKKRKNSSFKMKKRKAKGFFTWVFPVPVFPILEKKTYREECIRCKWSKQQEKHFTLQPTLNDEQTHAHEIFGTVSTFFQLPRYP